MGVVSWHLLFLLHKKSNQLARERVAAVTLRHNTSIPTANAATTTTNAMMTVFSQSNPNRMLISASDWAGGVVGFCGVVTI